ncbi:hypothetical protein ACFYO7_02490 [Nocardia salmonicida]|uniref:phosphotransferase-like protein n=1 Tax=Nocardia salmonicida TaxID=53431 RepID=UPI0036B6CE6A
MSSSGKSSIARRLLIDLERPFFHMGVDMIGAMRSESRTHELDSDLELDTGVGTIADCSAQITTFLARGSTNRAFDRLRAELEP